MKTTITHDGEKFVLTDEAGRVIDTNLNANKLAFLAWTKHDAQEVRHDYDLKLAEWKKLE